jgi:hypothetical protein
MINNLLPLEAWREAIGFHPYHFWGLSNSTVPVTSGCNSLVYKYAWQGVDQAGRDDIKQSIITAEERLRIFLNFSVAPEWVEETYNFPRFPDVGVSRLGYAGADNRWQTINLKRTKVIEAGVLARTLLATSNVVLSDVDSDTLNDTFTLTLAGQAGVVDNDEIAVYFAAADRLNGAAVGEDYRIEPIRVTTSGADLIIRGRSWQIVKPVLYEGFSKTGLDPATTGNFASTLEVYRLYNDPTGTTVDNAQATLIWETPPFAAWSGVSALDNSRDPAAIASATARVGIRNGDLGTISLGRAEYDTTTGNWYSVSWDTIRAPDRAIIRYRAGQAFENGQMEHRYRVIVARFAIAELARMICACDGSNRELHKWQFDLSRSAGVGDEQYRIADRDLNNPFGTARGHVYAWQEVENVRILRGFSV